MKTLIYLKTGSAWRRLYSDRSIVRGSRILYTVPLLITIHSRSFLRVVSAFIMPAVKISNLCDLRNIHKMKQFVRTSRDYIPAR